MDARIEKLKQKGIVLTIQRLAVMEFLHSSSSHPTAEAIHTKLKKKYPMMSLATVYNTLDMLKKAGEIQELTIGNAKHFDPIPQSHHHFYCRVCERILDVEVCCKIAKSGWVDQHKVEGVHAVFSGVCFDCHQRENGAQ
ncbi:MAG: transcriptional repressor [Candidatus Latescibacteria bacterium]|nr:transcriptional repressor [Candidatus Latescibacterota bacterium]